MKIGANHHFLRALRKLQNSLMMASLLIVLPFLAMKMHDGRPKVKLFDNFFGARRRNYSGNEQENGESGDTSIKEP